MLGRSAASTRSAASVDFHARSKDSLMPFERSNMTLWLLRNIAWGKVSEISHTTISLKDPLRLFILPKIKGSSLNYSTSRWPLNKTTISPFFCASLIFREACSRFWLLPRLTMFNFKLCKWRATCVTWSVMSYPGVVRHTTYSSFGCLTASSAATILFSGSTNKLEPTSSFSAIMQLLNRSGLNILVSKAIHMSFILVSFLYTSLISGHSINSGLSSLANRKIYASQLDTWSATN